MSIWVGIHWLFTLSLLVLWLLERKNSRKQIEGIRRRQTRMDHALTEFMEECEKTFREFSQLLSREPSSRERYPEVPSQSNPSRILPVEEKTEDNSPKLAKNSENSKRLQDQATNRKERVLRLAAQGLSSRKIAGRLTIPQGEVDLILNLRKGRPASRRSTTV